jgi:hypothetical protein
MHRLFLYQLLARDEIPSNISPTPINPLATPISSTVQASHANQLHLALLSEILNQRDQKAWY